jgi:hypothetical protein
MYRVKICKMCGAEFQPDSGRQRYCRAICSKKVKLDKNQRWLGKYIETPEGKEARRKHSRDHVQKVKLEVFSHYCNGVPFCQCSGCRTTYLGFLQLDHIEGGGSKQRRENKLSRTYALLGWLKRNNYPSGYQILCANCNSPGGKGAKKCCPMEGREH